MSIPAPAGRPASMRLIRQIRLLVTLIVLASHSPLGAAQGGDLGISLFVGRFTRVAAAQQLDPTKAAQPVTLQLRAVASMLFPSGSSTNAP